MNLPTKRDAILAYQFKLTDGSYAWDNLPDSLWWKLVSAFDALQIDGIGFQGLKSPSDEPNANLPSLTFKFESDYESYHISGKTSIAVFDLSASLIDKLASEPFDQWNKANPELPFDEIVFFKGNTAKIMAVPYENLVYFYGLARHEYDVLKSTEKRITENLFERDMSARFLIA